VYLLNMVEFNAVIKSITSKIDVVGDKVAKVTIEFLATDKNLTAITLLQQPETQVKIIMEMYDG